jgi:hypothetical protein
VSTEKPIKCPKGHVFYKGESYTCPWCWRDIQKANTASYEKRLKDDREKQEEAKTVRDALRRIR